METHDCNFAIKIFLALTLVTATCSRLLLIFTMFLLYYYEFECIFLDYMSKY